MLIPLGTKQCETGGTFNVVNKPAAHRVVNKPRNLLEFFFYTQPSSRLLSYFFSTIDIFFPRRSLLKAKNI